ncbi:MAG: carbon-nitrogen hydrolase family protein [Phycisphaeraceae bacterium]
MEPIRIAGNFIGARSEPWPTDWCTWSPRAALAPTFRVDDTGGRDGSAALLIAGNRDRAAYGEWRRRVDNIVGGQLYRFTTHYRAQNVTDPRQQLTARLEWVGIKDPHEHMPVYALETHRQGDWIRCSHVTLAPADATRALIRLGLRWCPDGKVWWDGVQVEQVTDAPARPVHLATVFHRPRDTASPAASVAQFVDVLTRHAPPPESKLDIVCLPEAMTMIGTGLTYADVAEPVPGPTTTTLGALAAKLNCYLVAGLIECDGDKLYNTAALLDRRGQLIGKYRKTHLPQGEADGGLTPGDDYPVFDTDFARVGILVCWDIQFPEAARALASRGAELLLLPIWGGNELLTRARAIENHVFVISSSYDMKSMIIDPTGRVLAQADPNDPAATQQPVISATVDLALPILQPWLGDMRTGTWAERRSDLRQ